MMNTSHYLQDNSDLPIITSRKERFRKGIITSVISFMMLFMVLITGLTSIQSHTAKADDNFDPIQFVMCYFGKSSMAGKAYQFATTDDVPFKLRSKSSVANGNNDVTQGFNWVLAFSGHDFKGINETILGHKLNDLTGADDTSTASSSSNASPSSDASSSSSSSSGSSSSSKASSTAKNSTATATNAPDDSTASSTTTSTPTSTSPPTSPSSSSTSTDSSSSDPSTGTDTNAASNDTTTSNDNKTKFNQGPVVNPYDRFGIAGMNFSAYLGEWKYVKINACATGDDAQPSDPKTGLFYDNRIVPQTTWDNIANTKDIRTAQLKKGVLSQEIIGFMTELSNFIFDITKCIVVFALALINFAFSDVVHLLGLDKIIAGNGHDKNDGIFGSLFDNLYMQLVGFMFVLTGLNMIYIALFKQAFRKSLNLLFRSLAMFFVAIFISVNPTVIISIPNTIAVAGQALIVKTVGTSIAGGNGLCKTQVGDKDSQGSTSSSSSTASSTPTPSSTPTSGAVTSADDTGTSSTGQTAEQQGFIAKASQNIESTIGCTFWQELLLKPWSQGQFGVDWNQTWSNGNIPDWAKNFDTTDPAASFTLNTKNANTVQSMKLVGDAAVPVGGGQFVKNWAIFQISTQTNVHSPIGHDGQASKQTANLADDWWRIVDITSGYAQTKKSMNIGKGDGSKDSDKQDYYVTDPQAVPLTVQTGTGQTVNVWDNWIGDSGGTRLLIALSSIPVALVAVAAPLFFSLLSAMYSIGTAILMVFAPIMLLLACWGDRGWSIFLGWFNMVISNMIKRIVCGLLLVVSILFTSAAITMIQAGDWLTGMLTMIILSFVMIKNRQKIFEALANFRIGNAANLDGTAKRVQTKLTSGTKRATKMGTNYAAGGVASARNGGTFREGASAGLRSDLRSIAYGNRTLRYALDEYDKNKIEKDGLDADAYNKMAICGECGQPTTVSQFVGVRADGSYICENCLLTGDYPDAEEQTVDWDTVREQLNQRQDKIDANGKDRKERIDSTTTKTEMDSSKNKAIIKKLRNGEIAPEDHYDQIGKVAAGVEEDINNYRTFGGDTPSVPSELVPYINAATMQQAWKHGMMDYVREAYIIAWGNWAVDNFGPAYADTVENIIEEIRLSEAEWADRYANGNADDENDEEYWEGEDAPEGKKNRKQQHDDNDNDY